MPSTCLILALDHVQLAMPEGAEDQARGFFGGLLGMEEVTKPSVLAGRGGVWFRAGSADLHLGCEKDFRPARKAHPAFRVAALAALRERLKGAGVAVTQGEDVPGLRRIHAEDPFGNRLEFLEDL